MAICDLCGSHPAVLDEPRVGELQLCGPCRSGEYGDRLAARGIAWQERRWVEDRGDNSHTVYVVELAGAVPFALDLRMELCVENAMHRIGKLFQRELQSGDPLFDRIVFVRTDTPERAGPVLACSGARDAILELLSITQAVHFDANAVSVLEFGTMSNQVPDTRALARNLAALLHHLKTVATELGLPPAPVDLSHCKGTSRPEQPEHAWDR